ncbi:MAG: putative glycoside hydrolase [Patescibacteria group bacterium]
MKKLIKFVILVVVIIGVAFFIWLRFFSNTPFDTYRPAPRATTITDLPKFPGFPLYGILSSKEKQDELVREIVDLKLTTYPAQSSRSKRAGKHIGSGIFGSFDPTEEQVAKLAPHYDYVMFGASKKELFLKFKKYNPTVKGLLYMDSALGPKFAEWKVQADPGSIDSEDTPWVVENHPEWLLKDTEGNIIVVGEGALQTPGTYLPDPGHPGYQEYFAEKVSKLLREQGGIWSGILLDDFMGSIGAYEHYSKTSKPAKYPTNEAFKNAQISFFNTVRKKINIPIVANIDGISVVLDPEVFGQIAVAAGGAESEVYPEEMPIEDMRRFLEVIEKIPKDKQIFIGSKPSPGWAGDIDKTLFAYYSYLLFADKDREAYWTYKEGPSDIPHYWFREFDLDLGEPLGEAEEMSNLFVREFENVIAVVNADNNDSHEFQPQTKGAFYDIAGNPLVMPITLEARTAVLIVKNPSKILNQH